MPMSLLLIDEADVAACVSAGDALEQMRRVFRHLAAGEAANFPVVRETVGEAVFGVKSGAIVPAGALGLKAGGYFPANALEGLSRHQSMIVLFDPHTGRPTALVSGNLITKLRTAAAAALSIELLADPQSRTLAIIGAGAQVQAHVEAAFAVRPFSRLRLWNRSDANARSLAHSLGRAGFPVDVAGSAKEAVGQADVVITLTPAREPIVERAWVRPGTHLACMGADTAGKQEVDVALLAAARVFTDSIEQAAAIGECQAGLRAGRFARDHIVGTLGDILLGRVRGRRSTDEITVFDGTGLAVQDLQMATLVLARTAASRGDGP